MRGAPRAAARIELHVSDRALVRNGMPRWLPPTSPWSRPTRVRCEFGDQSPAHPIPPAETTRRREQPVHVTSLLRLGLSPRCPVLPHPVSNSLALFLRHRPLPLGDNLERLLLAAPGRRRGIRAFERLDRTLYRNELSPERFLLILQGVQNSAFRHRDPASLDAIARPSRRIPIRTHAHGHRPGRRSAPGGYALLPAPSSRFRHCHARLLGGTRPLHASGRRSTPATRACRATPARRSRATAAAAASGEPYRSHNARNRIVVSTDPSASS